jgi:hypothetical protein
VSIALSLHCSKQLCINCQNLVNKKLDTFENICEYLFVNNGKQLLTVREQEFFAFWKKLKRPLPSQVEMARRMGFKDRQRVHQLIARLKDKGWI